MNKKEKSAMEYICQLCDTFKTDKKISLDFHCRKVHLTCLTCSMKFKNDSETKYHFENHANHATYQQRIQRMKEFKCESCEFFTKNEYYLKRHMREKHVDGSKISMDHEPISQNIMVETDLYLDLIDVKEESL